MATKDAIEFTEYKGHWPAFVSKKLFYPGLKLTEQFGQTVEPFIKSAINLSETNENLTLTRDMLLPRLISGKLSVENLDIQFPPGMEM